MSDLQLALTFLAAAILLAVYLHGRWQERQALRRLDASMRAGIGDALAQEPSHSSPATPRANLDQPLQRVEPRFDGPWGQRPMTLDPPHVVQLDDLRPLGAADVVSDAGPSLASPVARAAPVPLDVEARRGSDLDAPASRRTAGVHRASSSTDASPEDPLLDFAIELRCARAVDGVAVMDAAGPLLRRLGPLPKFVVAWDPRPQDWRLPDRFGFYADLLVGSQLAHRRHVMNDIDVSQFLSDVQQMALVLDAAFDPPDVKAVVEQAVALDRMVAPFDVQLGLTLESSNGAWEPRQLAAAAHQQALVPTAESHWERRDASGLCLFTLSSASLLNDKLALELDVPLAPAASLPLETMLSCAQALAASLNARIVDDNGRQIDAASVASIAAQIQRIYVDMHAAGLEAGDDRARRLFVMAGTGPESGASA